MDELLNHIRVNTQSSIRTLVPGTSFLFALILEYQKENIRLSAIRDGLLPRLMSGEIDVSDIDL